MADARDPWRAQWRHGGDSLILVAVAAAHVSSAGFLGGLKPFKPAVNTSNVNMPSITTAPPEGTAMSTDPTASTAVATFQVRHLSVPLPLPYDRAIERFGELVPAADLARFGRLADWDAVLEQAEVNAPHGFMVYWQADVTALMAGSGSGWQCTEYLMGNHVIAERMFRHDPTAMLYAPLRVVIHTDRTGHTRFAIDQPSTLFASLGNPDITAVGTELDALVADLLTALGATVPPELSA
ncbi:DUF302 domain-containing protein [Streptomyces sp. RPT161]|uniref:DUF302 domain-containing protein n=1 Tax=Streptomyces sp. RPT161 TaxID=3015993 RepID=UPI0022B8E153|nr:DUF302 domain-containing protein [Streptomyces sp. RPT161]